ncbi:MAG TPA: BTAD domain-containing putative transcriptional regulator [Acidimicrobiales bacterium]|jgi:DNA-binding SARP family transcriptional activator
MPRLSLLNGFELEVDGASVELSRPCQRLLAVVALNRASVARSTVAGVLWPERDERRSAANVRSTLWRLPAEVRALVRPDQHRISLDPSLRCDVDELVALAARLVDTVPVAAADLRVGPLLHDLLPAWYDDWVVVERERLRQLRVHALEALAARLRAESRFGESIEAGLAAVAAEPLRESAHRSLVETHLAEGNRTEAIRQCDLYRRLLRHEMGVDASPLLDALERRALGR